MMILTEQQVTEALKGTPYEGATSGTWAMIGTGLAGFGDTYAIGCKGGVVVQAGGSTFDGVECGIKGVFNAYLVRDAKQNAATAILLEAMVRELVGALDGLYKSYKSLGDSGDAGNWALEDTLDGQIAYETLVKAKAMVGE